MRNYNISKLVFAILFIFVLFNVSEARPKKIIIIETMPVNVIISHKKAFINHLASLNYAIGKDVKIDIIKAEGSREKARNLLNKSIQEETPDLVISLATLGSQVAYNTLKNTNIPIIFAVVADPVGAGIISQENVATGENITGRIYSMFRDTKIELLYKLLDKTKKDVIRFGVIHSDYPSSVGDYKGIITAAYNFEGIEFLSYQLPYVPVPKGIDAMLANTINGITALENKIDYWWYVAGPLAEIDEYHDVIVANSTKPVLMGHRTQNVKDGALMSVAPNFEAGGREIAELAVKVLNGEDVGDIPVIAPKNFTLAINLTKAIDLGLTIPADILRLAGKNVYR